MSFLTLLAKRAVNAPSIAARIDRWKQNVIRAMIGSALLALFGILSLMYLLSALRLWLERFLGYVWSPVAIGVVFFIGAAVAYLVFLRPERASNVRVKDPKNAAPAFISQLQEKLSSIPVAKVGIAVAGGIATALGWRFLLQKRDVSKQNGEFADSRGPARPWASEIVLRETRPRSR